MIRGSYWECGWCGDCGMLQRAPAKESEREAVQTPSAASNPSCAQLTELWIELRKALSQLAPKQKELSHLLGKVLLHYISAGIQHAAGSLEKEKAEELRLFLKKTPDLNLGMSADETLRAAGQNVLFCEEAELTETECGTFWEELLSARPVEDYYDNSDPDGLYDFLSALSRFYTYFCEEDGGEQEYLWALQDAYYAQRQDRAVLHPDAARAERLLSEGKFPANEDLCREILLVEYPEEVPHKDAEELDDLSWKDILNDVFSRNIVKGIEMWRTLLDAAGPAMRTSPKTAEKLLPDWEWLGSPNQDQMLPLLVAMDDDQFMSQLFESAFIGRLQLDIVSACRDCELEKLGKQCVEAALENPYLQESWEKRLRRVFPDVSWGRPRSRANAAGRTMADPKSDDGTVFHYCSVQVQGMRQPYSYLTGGLPLKVGDWVELPFGADDEVRKAQVKAVMDCTRLVAPWPPEKTKTVLRIAEPPAPRPKKKAPEPEPEEWVIRIGPEPDEIEEAPEPAEIGKEPEPAEAAKNEAAQAQPEPPAAAEEKKPEPPHERSQFAISYEAYLNRNPWKKREIEYEKHAGRKRIVKRVLALAAVCAVVVFLVVRKEQRAQIYDTALEYLAGQEFLKAELEFSKLPRYRDAAQLAVYCKYASAYRTNTNYIGGAEELSYIHLQFETGWQQDVDALEKRVEGYKKQKESEEAAALRAQEAAAAASRDEELKRLYTGKQPVDGMPANGLKYTTLGAPSQTKNCRDYNSLVYNRRYKTLYWYNSLGQTIASCKSHQLSENGEEVIYDFKTFSPPLGSSNTSSSIGGSSSFGGSSGSSGSGHSSSGSSSSSSSGSSHSGSIRDDYDTPEDLWEDNQDWYEDEDEAWDEWYDG